MPWADSSTLVGCRELAVRMQLFIVPKNVGALWRDGACLGRMNPVAEGSGFKDVSVPVNLAAHAVVVNEALVRTSLEPVLAGQQRSRRDPALAVRGGDAHFVVNPLALRQEFYRLREGVELRVFGFFDHGVSSVTVLRKSAASYRPSLLASCCRAINCSTVLYWRCVCCGMAAMTFCKDSSLIGLLLVG